MRFPVYILAVFAVFVSLASPCSAQSVPNLRSYLSGLGSDSNPCTRASPCQSLAAALSNTVAGGEIDCLDAGEYQTSPSPKITRSVSIICDGVNGGFLHFGNDNSQIIVNLPYPTDRVVLSGLNLDGAKLAGSGALFGLQITGIGSVTIRNSQIRNYEQEGVILQGVGNSLATRVVIQNTYITNSGIGVLLSGTGGARIFIRDSFIENCGGGVSVAGSGGGNSVAISNTVIDNNGAYALNVAGAGNSAAFVNSILSGSPAGIMNAGGSVNSIGPSNVISGTGSPTANTPYR